MVRTKRKALRKYTRKDKIRKKHKPTRRRRKYRKKTRKNNRRNKHKPTRRRRKKRKKTRIRGGNKTEEDKKNAFKQLKEMITGGFIDELKKKLPSGEDLKEIKKVRQKRDKAAMGKTFEYFPDGTGVSTYTQATPTLVRAASDERKQTEEKFGKKSKKAMIQYVRTELTNWSKANIGTGISRFEKLTHQRKVVRMLDPAIEAIVVALIQNQNETVPNIQKAMLESLNEMEKKRLEEDDEKEFRESVKSAKNIGQNYKSVIGTKVESNTTYPKTNTTTGKQRHAFRDLHLGKRNQQLFKKLPISYQKGASQGDFKELTVLLDCKKQGGAYYWELEAKRQVQGHKSARKCSDVIFRGTNNRDVKRLRANKSIIGKCFEPKTEATCADWFGSQEFERWKKIYNEMDNDKQRRWLLRRGSFPGCCGNDLMHAIVLGSNTFLDSVHMEVSFFSSSLLIPLAYCATLTGNRVDYTAKSADKGRNATLMVVQPSIGCTQLVPNTQGLKSLVPAQRTAQFGPTIEGIEAKKGAKKFPTTLRNEKFQTDRKGQIILPMDTMMNMAQRDTIMDKQVNIIKCPPESVRFLCRVKQLKNAPTISSTEPFRNYPETVLSTTVDNIAPEDSLLRTTKNTSQRKKITIKNTGDNGLYIKCHLPPRADLLGNGAWTWFHVKCIPPSVPPEQEFRDIPSTGNKQFLTFLEDYYEKDTGCKKPVPVQEKEEGETKSSVTSTVQTNMPSGRWQYLGFIDGHYRWKLVAAEGKIDTDLHARVPGPAPPPGLTVGNEIAIVGGIIL